MSPRRILLTGAGRGIGRACALAFASEAAQIVLVARSQDELESVASEVRAAGGTAHVLVLDLAGHAAIPSACAAAIETLGGSLDVLINNAGIFDTPDFESMSLAFWQRMLDVNLTAPMLIAQACIPAMARAHNPVIINVASIAAEQGFPGSSAYCASKYGLRGLGDVQRLELAERGIAVRTVLPTGTDTSIFDKVEGDWNRAAMDSPESVATLILKASQPGAPDELRMYEKA